MTSLIRNLSERISLYALKTTPDNMGGWTEEWTFKGAYWAALKPLSVLPGSLSIHTLGAYGPEGPFFHLTVRKETPLKKGDRLHWKDQRLSILSDPSPTPDFQGICAYTGLLNSQAF